MSQTVAIFGRLPGLSLAELESLYGADVVKPIGSFGAIIDMEPATIDFTRLGGTVKFAKLLTILDSTKWQDIQRFLEQNIPKHLGFLPEGKLRLGLSVYGLHVSVKQINATGLELKKVIRQTGRSARVIPNKELALNSAQVLHNQLTGQLGWEFIFIRDGGRTIVAQNIAEQDIDAYAARDQARPKRDARVGMLPPKLAQTIVNLATGRIMHTESGIEQSASRDDGLQTVPENSVGLDESQGKIEGRSEAYNEVRRASTGDFDTAIRQEQDPVASSAREQVLATKTILDPFCGTGVVLQEAALMGYDTYGTDLEQRMIDFSRDNLDWLGEHFSHPPFTYSLDQGDATEHKWHSHFDMVASEAYLGQPFSSLPTREKLEDVRKTTDIIIKKFLKNLASQTKPGFRLCLAVPAWQTPDGVFHLPTLDHLEEIGYTRMSFVHTSNDDLLYYREGQIVARELLVLTRK